MLPKPAKASEAVIWRGDTRVKGSLETESAEELILVGVGGAFSLSGSFRVKAVRIELEICEDTGSNIQSSQRSNVARVSPGLEPVPLKAAFEPLCTFPCDRGLRRRPTYFRPNTSHPPLSHVVSVTGAATAFLQNDGGECIGVLEPSNGLDTGAPPS